MDRREDILNKEHRDFVKEEGTASIHTKNFPDAWKLQAFAAMDEYMKECCLELLEYLAKNDVKCTWYEHEVLGIQYRFHFKGESITKEKLFENFL